MQLPRWQLTILVTEQARIEATRLSAAMTAATSPHLTPRAQRDLVRRVRRTADLPRPEPAEIPKERHDPAAAAAWFAERGIKVEVA
jgi:hypothetical protein